MLWDSESTSPQFCLILLCFLSSLACLLVCLLACSEFFKYARSITIELYRKQQATCKTATMKMTFILKDTFFMQVEQVVRKPNPRADRIFLKKEAFFHLRKHKTFSPVELMKRMEIANAPLATCSNDLILL